MKWPGKVKLFAYISEQYTCAQDRIITHIHRVQTNEQANKMNKRKKKTNETTSITNKTNIQCGYFISNVKTLKKQPQNGSYRCLNPQTQKHCTVNNNFIVNICYILLVKILGVVWRTVLKIKISWFMLIVIHVGYNVDWVNQARNEYNYYVCPCNL